MSDKRFGNDTGNSQWRSVRVIGIEYIFKVLCLICKIMIYRLPVKDSIDSANKNAFKDELKELIGDVK